MLTESSQSAHSTKMAAFLHNLPDELRAKALEREIMSRYTTLRVGGEADFYLPVRSRDEFAVAASIAQTTGMPLLVLGGGSNACISDKGIRGLVIHNLCVSATVGETTNVDCGHSFMRLFQKSASMSLSGLEFAVGIPGSVGGALVSNAGAYRQNICDIVRSIDIVENGIRQVVGPEWMQFSYRDSRIRRSPDVSGALLGVELTLTPANRKDILARARDNQRQRIFKQPWNPSAGSFFKNVVDRALAEIVPGLPTAMRDAGIVPAGFLSAAVECKGLRVGGAQISARHGNFVINRGHATAAEIVTLTREVKQRVHDKFGVKLEEEVMFIGDWSGVDL